MIVATTGGLAVRASRRSRSRLSWDPVAACMGIWPVSIKSIDLVDIMTVT
jgi:hypothetical protein